MLKHSLILSCFLIGAIVQLPALASGTANFICPEGQTYKNHLKPEDDLKFEWCVDDQKRIQGLMRVSILSDGRIDTLIPYVDGKKHGIGTQFDVAGDPGFEVVYEHGVKIRSGLSRQALVKIAEEISTDAQKRGKSWHARVINDRTILYEVLTTVPRPEKVIVVEPKDTPAILRTQFCGMFANPDALWDAVEVRFINEDGELVQTGTFRPSDCDN